ncbi:hypothetical protein CORC01_04973 [Colletotrichum orchidophilum]|uniref:Uncharacterized protein n=1 Tax=Colletotrichum orchidophilum TaxID=1209926 RepID=A0A1G4BE62_9PEZI|nr:uncharacterized protein CORC01_04973 [Colletotrichum orchidophilum]OHE99615.1 hypothetical protein CORC01_04973 [Colletotrichum orchidophilum]
MVLPSPTSQFIHELGMAEKINESTGLYGSKMKSWLIVSGIVSRRSEGRILSLVCEDLRVDACVHQLSDGLEKRQGCTIADEDLMAYTLEDELPGGLLFPLQPKHHVPARMSGLRTEDPGRYVQTETAFAEGGPALVVSAVESIDTWKDVDVSSSSCMATFRRI